IKEIEQFNKKLTTLSKFLTGSAIKSLSFYATLKKNNIKIFTSKKYHKNNRVINLVSKPTKIPSYKLFNYHK
ncbi:hypothetical protein C1T30_43255, partial [Bacillus sp. MBGLi97]